MSSMEIEEDGQTLFLRGDFDVRSRVLHAASFSRS